MTSCCSTGTGQQRDAVAAPGGLNDCPRKASHAGSGFCSSRVVRLSGMMILIMACGTLRAAAQDAGSSIFFAFMPYHYGYKENFPLPGKSEESGWLPGFMATYMFRGVSIPLFGELRAEYTNAPTTYDGSVVYPDGTVEAFSGSTSNVFLRAQIRAGYVFERLGDGTLSVAPYFGYGFRFWQRILPGGSAGYEEDYRWSYLPVGMIVDVQLSDLVTLGIDAAARFMFGGSIDVKLQAFNNPTLTLGNVTGWSVAFPLTVRLSPSWSLSVAPHIETSGIGESNPSPVVEIAGRRMYIKEPSSTTGEYGLTLGAELRF